MTETELRGRIKAAAVDQFDRDGYHGATIRSIAREVGCSLPMVYYYYQSKQELFHEIIRQDYFALLQRQAGRSWQPDLLDFYTDFVYQLNFLSDHDRKVYRLGVKVYLGFDGDPELIGIMEQWEQSIWPRHYQLVLPHLKGGKDGEVLVRTLVHLLENRIEAIVVKNRFLPEPEIREELAVILGQL